MICGRGSNHFPSHVNWLHCSGGSWVARGSGEPGCHFIFGPNWSPQGQEISFSRPGRPGPPFNLRVWMSGPSLLRLESAIADWVDTFWILVLLMNRFWTKLNHFEMRNERGCSVMMVSKEANTWYLSLRNNKKQPWSNLLTAETKYIIRNL